MTKDRHDPDFQKMMAIAEEGMERYRHALRALATDEPGDPELRAGLLKRYGVGKGDD